MKSRDHVKPIASAGAAIFICFANYSSAYQVTTHAALTSEATAASAIGRDTATPLLSRLGLVDFNNTLGSRYFDLGATLVARDGMAVEQSIFNALQFQDRVPIPEAFTITGWIMRGAVRED